MPPHLYDTLVESIFYNPEKGTNAQRSNSMEEQLKAMLKTAKANIRYAAAVHSINFSNNQRAKLVNAAQHIQDVLNTWPEELYKDDDEAQL